MDVNKVPLLAATVVTGAFVLLSYKWLYDNANTSTVGTFKWWFFPFNPAYIPLWLAYSFTTVAAYFVVAVWMFASDAVAAPQLWYLVAFNCAAFTWCWLTRASYVHSVTALSFLPVAATAAACALWTENIARESDPPNYVVAALVALNIHHTVVDCVWWGGGRLLSLNTN